MKPRTQLEKDLQSAIDKGKLHPLTKKQMEQAHKEMRKEKKQRIFVFVAKQTINGMVMTKLYKVRRVGRGETFTYYQLCLIKAERNGEVAWAGRQCGIGYCLDNFSNDGPLTIKTMKWWYGGYINNNVELRSQGDCNQYSVVFHRNLNDYEFCDTRVESIISAGYQSIVDYLIENHRPLTSHLWAAFKVAHRQHYPLERKDIYKWSCLINMLREFKKDYRNPHYICPADLSEAYNKMVDKIDEKRRLAAEARRNKAEEEIANEWRDKYVKQHKKWLGIVIRGKGICITPLQSVDEFREEGRAMHHCVFANGYFKKKETLILSAKDDEGNRLATIEYDLKKRLILQCRAACNSVPQKKQEIEALINNNLLFLH